MVISIEKQEEKYQNSKKRKQKSNFFGFQHSKRKVKIKKTTLDDK